MSGPAYVLSKGFLVGEAIAQYHFVKLVGSETINICDTQGEKAIGVAQEELTASDATNSRIGNVQILGVSRVIAGAAITEFANVTVGADGRAEPAILGDVVVGIAMNAAAADGDHFDVLLTPSGYIVA